MDKELLTKYYRHLKRNPSYELLEKDIELFRLSQSERTFYIKQELIDANIDFPRLIGYSESIDKVVIDSIKEDIWSYLAPLNIFENIVEIKIFNSDINHLFKFSNKLKNVERIEILHTDESNHLNGQKIPAEIQHLSNIKELFINSPFIEEVSNNVCDLKTLTDLTWACIAPVPECLYKLKLLKSLRVNIRDEYSNREDIFKTLQRLDNLESFGYDDPFSSIIPDFRSNLNDLKNFSFSMVRLHELPDFIRNYKKLKYLRWSLTLDKIPDWIIDLEELEYLCIEGLNSTELPLFLHDLTKLNTIDLTGSFEITCNNASVENILRDFPNHKIIPLNANF